MGDGHPGNKDAGGVGERARHGRTADGRDWRTGGWGRMLDDLGSGCWFGVQAMIAVTCAADGRGRGCQRWARRVTC